VVRDSRCGALAASWALATPVMPSSMPVLRAKINGFEIMTNNSCSPTGD
jgi:hypothetical protein